MLRFSFYPVFNLKATKLQGTLLYGNSLFYVVWLVLDTEFKSMLRESIYAQLKTAPSVAISFQAVYIAPLKALVRERMEDWKIRFEQKLGRR